MKKILIAVAALFLAAPLFCFDMQGDKSVSTFQDFGNRVTPFTITAGTTTPVLFYSEPEGRSDRSLELCNPTSFYVFASTFSTANTGTQLSTTVMPNLCKNLSTASTWYAVLETVAGSLTKRLNGMVTGQSSDQGQ